MKISASSNIFTYTADQVIEKYAAFLSGNPRSLFCLVSAGTPSPQVAQAMAGSAAKLGYGAGECCCISLQAGEDWLTEDDLFALIEGLEPLAVVAADLSAMQALGLAYRCEFATSTRASLLGRRAVGFQDFAAMLASPQEKQRAWALLKTLKRK